MAEAISLAASIVALIGATDAVGKNLSKAQLLYRAPVELLALNNEVADLTVVLRNLENYMHATTSTTTQESANHLITLIERARDRILQLDQLIHYEFLKSGSFNNDDYKVFRLRWVRSKKIVEGHRQALHDAKLNIVIHMLAIDASYQGRIQLIIDEIFTNSNQFHNRQIHSSESIIQQLKYHSQALDAIQTTQRSFFQRNQEHFTTQSRLLENIANTTAKHQDVLQVEASHTQKAQSMIKSPTNSFQPALSQSIFGVRARIVNRFITSHQQSFCSPCCTCKCHTLGSFRTPRLFNKTLGSLFIEYSGYPSAFTECTDKNCQFSARVTYTFPLGLFHKMIDIFLAVSKVQNPFLNITVRAIVPASADVFRLTKLDDRTGLEELFSNREARPNDLQWGDERCALHIAVALGCLQAAEVLLKAGTDPHYRNSNVKSAHDLAWDRIFSTVSDPVSLNHLRALFPSNDDWLEERQFSKLHSIVLSLLPGNLEEVLAEPNVNINATDSGGRTALSWAVQINDCVSTKLLLQHGADPNIINLAGNSPIATAAYRQNAIGIKLLLDYSAVITLRNRQGRGILHFACSNATSSATSCEALEVLIAAGCDIHQKNDLGSTPFNLAAPWGSSAVLRTLMRHGSDINTIDLEGDCPLSNALINCRNDNVLLLLESGADYTIINNSGRTILHQAALSGDLATIQILRSANITRIDPNTKNKKGKTALQLAQERYTKPEGFINLFLTLLFEIRCRNDALTQGARSQGVTSAKAREVSASMEAGRDGNSKGTTVDTDGSIGIAEPGRDDEDGVDGGGTFFDALEQQSL